MRDLMRLPGARLVSHAVLILIIWFVMMWVNNSVDPLMNYYIALVAMYATAMFGMVILVGLSGQVSLGNGALMAMDYETGQILAYQGSADPTATKATKRFTEAVVREDVERWRAEGSDSGYGSFHHE